MPRESTANLQSGITALEERAASFGQATEELNRRTFYLNTEAERRALITAALETRLERAEATIRDLQRAAHRWEAQ